MSTTEQRTSDRTLTLRYVLVLGVIAVLCRLAPYYLPPGTHLLWNMMPVGALALFAGSRLRERWAWLVPLAVMLISDLLLIRPLAAIGMSGLSWGTPIRYASFLIYVPIGRMIRKDERSGMVVGGAALLGSVQFFLITNFAEWPGSTTYPQTFAGLMQCLAAGVPFYRGTLAGDLFFAGLIFCVHAVLLGRVELAGRVGAGNTVKARHPA